MIRIRKWLNTILFLMISPLIFVPPVWAQQTVRLEIRLRDGGGTAVSGEVVTLQRLPEEDAHSQECITNDEGVCTWQVGRGLYQLLFARPLDEVSALELAEGGLRGFGITVGDDPITYHFTLQSNAQIYFDAAPESIIPVPIVPTFEPHHEETESAPAIVLTAAEPVAEIELVPVEGTAISLTIHELNGETAVDSVTNPIWQLLFYIGLGLFIGGTIYAWPKAARRAAKIKRVQSPIPDPSTCSTPLSRSGQVPQSPSKESDHA